MPVSVYSSHSPAGMDEPQRSHEASFWSSSILCRYRSRHGRQTGASSIAGPPQEAHFSWSWSAQSTHSQIVVTGPLIESATTQDSSPYDACWSQFRHSLISVITYLAEV